MIEVIGLFVVTISVAGVVLNNARRRACFLLWLVSNTLSAGIHIHAGMWSLTARDLIFLILAVVGWRAWGKRIS